MKLEISSAAYTLTAVLTAVKKQQIFANWQLIERTEKTTTISFSHREKANIDEESCVLRFRRQLDDEQIREKLEKDFGTIRDRLVATALGPIASVEK